MNEMLQRIALRQCNARFVLRFYIYRHIYESLIRCLHLDSACIQFAHTPPPPPQRKYIYQYLYNPVLDIPTDLGFATNEIPNSQMTSSSALSEHDSFQGRLNYHRLAYAWCAKVQDTNQWLQFNLGHTMLVMGIVTQSRGRAPYTGQMITAYKVWRDTVTIREKLKEFTDY